MTADRANPPIVVASHRRSGTHLMLTYLTEQFGLRPRKIHGFPGKSSAPTVYLVRNPIDVLWSTYRWFADGRSSNTRIRSAFEGIDFAAYLRGEAGPRVGYRALAQPPGDSLAATRGMFYDPVRFWADHVDAYTSGEVDALPVRYEQLVLAPEAELVRVAAYLGIEHLPQIRPIGRDELVGHAPSPSTAPPAIDQWSPESLRLLLDRAGHVMEHFQLELPTSRTPRRRPVQALRYVSRDDNSGYAVAGRRCIGALTAAGIDVAWEPQPNEWGDRAAPTSTTPDLLSALYQPTARCDNTVMHTMPEWWAGLRRSFGRGRYTGHTVWELEDYPEEWHRTAFAADELWVPTDWNRVTFQRGGAKQPVRVLPHVITTDPAHEPPIDLPSDVTVFVTVASWHPRKRPDLVVEAFARAFRRCDPVLLVVKTAAWTDSWPANDDLQRMTWWQLLQVLRRHPDAPEVMLVNDEFTDAQVNGLLQRADCYVSLASSEGWGLGMFDAATLGTPVITTGFGGHLAYLGRDHPGLVPYRMSPVGNVENSPHFQDGMTWAAPDIDAAAAMMRSIVDGTSPLPAAATALAERLRTTYSPAVVGQLALTLLEDHL